MSNSTSNSTVDPLHGGHDTHIPVWALLTIVFGSCIFAMVAALCCYYYSVKSEQNQERATRTETMHDVFIQAVEEENKKRGHGSKLGAYSGVRPGEEHHVPESEE